MDDIKARNLQGLEKAQGYRGILLVKHRLISRHNQILMNK